MPTGGIEKVSVIGGPLKPLKRRCSFRNRKSWQNAQNSSAGANSRYRPRAVPPQDNTRQQQESGKTPHRNSGQNEASRPHGSTPHGSTPRAHKRSNRKVRKPVHKAGDGSGSGKASGLPARKLWRTKSAEGDLHTDAAKTTERDGNNGGAGDADRSGTRLPTVLAVDLLGFGHQVRNGSKVRARALRQKERDTDVSDEVSGDTNPASDSGAKDAAGQVHCARHSVRRAVAKRCKQHHRQAAKGVGEDDGDRAAGGVREATQERRNHSKADTTRPP